MLLLNIEYFLFKFDMSLLLINESKWFYWSESFFNINFLYLVVVLFAQAHWCYLHVYVVCAYSKYQSSYSVLDFLLTSDFMCLVLYMIRRICINWKCCHYWWVDKMIFSLVIEIHKTCIFLRAALLASSLQLLFVYKLGPVQWISKLSMVSQFMWYFANRLLVAWQLSSPPDFGLPLVWWTFNKHCSCSLCLDMFSLSEINIYNHFIHFFRRPTALHDRTRDSDEEDIRDRDYDVAALANNLSQAFQYGVSNNENIQEVLLEMSW